jgi:glycolate oxidase FAD binding subunit
VSAPIAPTREADLVAIIRTAAAAKRGLVTEGSGTKRHFGPAAPADAQRVSLRALNRILAYAPGDMVVCVEAGTRMADLQRVLATRNQWLAIDPPFADATVGGVVATHSSGPRRLGYGTVRDMVLGARVLGAGGDSTKSGGRVVKNVSGYDLHKLQVGAFGSLGVLVEVNFRVSALPETAAVVWLATPSLAVAHETLVDVACTALRPCALEAFDPRSVDDLSALVPELPTDTSLGIIGIEGSGPILERHLRDLASFRTHAVASGVLQGPSVERFWEAVRDLPSRRARDVTVRVGARPHDLVRLLGELETTAFRHAGTVIQAALGIARISIRLPDGSPSFGATLANWQKLAKARGGYAVVESAPLDCLDRAGLPWTVPHDHALGSLLKHRWDPDQILNPGRMAC